MSHSDHELKTHTTQYNEWTSTQPGTRPTAELSADVIVSCRVQNTEPVRVSLGLRGYTTTWTDIDIARERWIEWVLQLTASGSVPFRDPVIHPLSRLVGCHKRWLQTINVAVIVDRLAQCMLGALCVCRCVCLFLCRDVSLRKRSPAHNSIQFLCSRLHHLASTFFRAPLQTICLQRLATCTVLPLVD